MKNKFLVLIFTAAVILITVFGTLPASAYYGRTEDGFIVENYNEPDVTGNIPTDENGEFYLIVTGYHGSKRSITVPSEVDGRTVRYIKKAAFACNEKITKVVLPDTIAEIGDEVFSYCINLLSVTLPASCDKIPAGTFRGCTLLQSVKLPESVAYIGDFAFEGCAMMTSLVVPAAVEFIGHNAFTTCENLILDCGANTYAKEYAAGNNVIFEKEKNPNLPVYTALLITLILGIAVFAADFAVRRILRSKNRMPAERKPDMQS